MLLPTAEVLALGRYSTCILILKCVSITYLRNPAQIHISKPWHWFYDLHWKLHVLFLSIQKYIIVHLSEDLYTYMTCWQYLTSIPTCPSDIFNVWVRSFTEFQVFAGHAWYYPDLPEGVYKNPVGKNSFRGEKRDTPRVGVGCGFGRVGVWKGKRFWADVMKSHFP